MCKSEVFNRVAEVVARETEVYSDELIGHGRTMEAVDARCIFFQMLREKGFTTGQIAYKTRRTAAAVRYLLSKYEERVAQNKLVNLYAQKVRKQLENN